MRIRNIPLLVAAVLCVFLIPAGAAYAEPFAEAEIPASCRVSRKVPEKYRDFTYTLTAESGSPMPEGSAGGVKTVHMKKSGKIDFGKIRFDHPEMYSYTVRDTTPEFEGLIKDSDVYKVSLMADTGGKVRITVKNGSGEKQDGIVFRDTYNSGPAGAGSPKMGDDERAALWLAMLLIGAAAALAVTAKLRRAGR